MWGQADRQADTQIIGRTNYNDGVAGWCRAGAFCGIQCVGARVWDGVAAGA